MADTAATEKAALRQRLRTERDAHVAALPDSTRALLFRRPPRRCWRWCLRAR